MRPRRTEGRGGFSWRGGGSGMNIIGSMLGQRRRRWPSIVPTTAHWSCLPVKSVSLDSSHYPQEVLLTQFGLYVHYMP